MTLRHLSVNGRCSYNHCSNLQNLPLGWIIKETSEVVWNVLNERLYLIPPSNREAWSKIASRFITDCPPSLNPSRSWLCSIVTTAPPCSQFWLCFAATATFWRIFQALWLARDMVLDLIDCKSGMNSYFFFWSRARRRLSEKSLYACPVRKSIAKSTECLSAYISILFPLCLNQSTTCKSVQAFTSIAMPAIDACWCSAIYLHRM